MDIQEIEKRAAISATKRVSSGVLGALSSVAAFTVLQKHGIAPNNEVIQGAIAAAVGGVFHYAHHIVKAKTGWDWL